LNNHDVANCMTLDIKEPVNLRALFKLIRTLCDRKQ